MQNRSVNTIARTLIQTVVRQKLTAIKNDPERSLRSLVDMGLNFAGGSEQQHILQLAQQIQYLRLDGNIQRGYRLIADYQRRVKHDRAGNTDSLTLSAGELVRIAVVVFGVQSYDLHHL